MGRTPSQRAGGTLVDELKERVPLWKKELYEGDEEGIGCGIEAGFANGQLDPLGGAESCFRAPKPWGSDQQNTATV